ncbi:MAG: peptidase, partial [Bacilli bacterium]
MKKRILRCSVILFSMFFLAQTAGAALPVFTQMAAKAGKAVVNISTVKTVTARDSLKRFIPKSQQGTPFEDFFDQFDQFFGKK